MTLLGILRGKGGDGGEVSATCEVEAAPASGGEALIRFVLRPGQPDGFVAYKVALLWRGEIMGSWEILPPRLIERHGVELVLRMVPSP